MNKTEEKETYPVQYYWPDTEKFALNQENISH